MTERKSLDVGAATRLLERMALLRRQYLVEEGDLLRDIAAALPQLVEDAGHLDWLIQHHAYVEEFPNPGEFQVVVFNEQGEGTCLAQRSRSPRDALRAARAAREYFTARDLPSEPRTP